MVQYPKTQRKYRKRQFKKKLIPFSSHHVLADFPTILSEGAVLGLWKFGASLTHKDKVVQGVLVPTT